MKKKAKSGLSIRLLTRDLNNEKKAHQTTLDILGARQSELDAERANVFHLLKDNRALSGLSQENDRLKAEIERLRLSPRIMPRSVDPTAEVVMNMKRAMESSIGAQASLLDAMGELVDHVSGRKARRERDQERDLSIMTDPTGDR